MPAAIIWDVFSKGIAIGKDLQGASILGEKKSEEEKQVGKDFSARNLEMIFFGKKMVVIFEC